MSNLDFAALTVTDASEAPKVAPGRGRTSEPNPFLASVKDSFENKKPKSVTIPLAGENGKTREGSDNGKDLNVTAVTGMLRKAGAEQNITVRTEVIINASNREKNGVPAKSAEIRFLGREKITRARTASEQADERAEQTPDA